MTMIPAEIIASFIPLYLTGKCMVKALNRFRLSAANESLRAILPNFRGHGRRGRVGPLRRALLPRCPKSSMSIFFTGILTAVD